ncbi:hypothetical protein Dda_3994 [Drechslerella dactyloides]|uniref:Uncharacterized protein n=1 Tax=Drechslerella dactyloides TaxID=74499 RepID=A0AAD6NKF8_DREDA|nr:hypothetical protein Dda_3994 [Drechslerella dactyloides]
MDVRTASMHPLERSTWLECEASEAGQEGAKAQLDGPMQDGAWLFERSQDGKAMRSTPMTAR